jgi:hypothetical protein
MTCDDTLFFYIFLYIKWHILWDEVVDVERG